MYKADSTDLRRLLIRPGAIGDFILSLPALEFVKTRDTELWCSAQNVPLATFADRAFSIGSIGLDRVGVLPSGDVFERLRQFDEIHSWYGANRTEFREAVSGLPFFFYAALPADGRTHATAFYCGQVGAPLAAPRLFSQSGSDSSSRPSLSPFTVLHPFASSPRKRWPLDRFRRLASLLGDIRFCAGSGEELDGAIRIENLGELARFLSSARGFVGNDSGITHLAAAVGIPVLALFGPTDPRVWAPLGANVTTLSRMPLEEIQPEEVFDLIRAREKETSIRTALLL